MEGKGEVKYGGGIERRVEGEKGGREVEMCQGKVKKA